MTYPAAIEFLYTLRLFGANLGLENTRRLAALFGNPQRKLRFIHVAGTNGKGSTCAMLESIYRTAGYRVGLFTSPHLVRFRERFQVNRQLISEARTAELVEELRTALRQFSSAAHPTFFEVVTVMALRYFAQCQCDLVVWETGLGGRLDATNIVMPLASVITNVQLDHEKWLGQTRSQIAFEKAGIIKPGVPVVTAESSPKVLNILRRQAHKLKAPFHHVRLAQRSPSVLHDVTLPLPGRHQKLNAALAIATVDLLSGTFKVRRPQLRDGLSLVTWPGRLQVIPQSAGGHLILDGAHNPAAARALRAALRKLLTGSPLTLILGIFHDKDWRGVSRILAPLARKIIVTKVNSPRAVPTLELANACKKANPRAVVRRAGSVKRALALARQDKQTLVTGSLYLIGEALAALSVPAEVPLELQLNEWSGGAGDSCC